MSTLSAIKVVGAIPKIVEEHEIAAQKSAFSE